MLAPQRHSVCCKTVRALRGLLFTRIRVTAVHSWICGLRQVTFFALFKPLKVDRCLENALPL